MFRFSPIGILVLAACLSPPAGAQVRDWPSSFFPGRYFEHKAQFYLKTHSYRAALEMFQLSGFWADKRAQYNVGIMLFNGIGVPADRVRAAAWFRIAAEAHDDLAERARDVAMAVLSVDERIQADAAWRELDAKYGDKVTLPRAIGQYAMDKGHSTNFGFPTGNLQVYEANGDGLGTPGSAYFSARDAELAELIREIRGTVTVGTVQTLPVSASADSQRSDIPLGDARTPSPAH